jgi:putative ABC transport system permease protein
MQLSMLKEWLTRLRFLMAPRPHQETDEELQFHLEEQTRANVAAGMAPQEAHRQAVIALGGIEKAKEQAHEQRPGFYMETFLQDIRYSIRGFGRNPVFTLTLIVTLMLGIGATTAIFSIVDRILFRDLPYAHAERLVSVGMVHSVETQEFMMGNFYYNWRDHQKPFEAMTSEQATAHECDLTEGKPTQLNCESVEGNFLSVLGVSPVLGRNFLADETRPRAPDVALISYGLWLTHYGRDPGILNKTIAIDGSPVRVIGVLPRNFEMPRLQAVDVVFPMTVDEAADRTANGGYGGPRRAFARLKPGVTVQQAQAAIEPLFQQDLKSIPAELRYDVHLKIRSLRERQMQEARAAAWVLLAAVCVMLLIACANVASLLMARGASRVRELAVRSALGASRVRLVRQALTEAMMLSIAGAVAGCALAEGLLHLFIAIAPPGIPYLDKTGLDLRIIGFSVVLSIVCGVFFGLAPSVQKPKREALNGRLTLVSHATLRQWLVVTQIAASMVLLAGAVLLLRSFRNLENQNLGMREDSTLTVSVTLGEHNYPNAQSMMTFFQQLERRLRFGPGVSVVATTDSLPPLSEHNKTRFDLISVSGQPPFTRRTGTVVTYRLVSPDYFRVLDIPIVEGKSFNDQELNSSDHLLVLSQWLATLLFPGKNAVGERIRFGSGADDVWNTVVGVAANVKNGGLTGEEEPEYYALRRNRPEDWDNRGRWGRTSVVIVRSALGPKAMAPWIRSQVAAIDPTLPVDIATLRERVSKLADQPRFQTTLVSFFAATGLVLSMVGLYGVITFLVTQRTQEIGVRMALGADRGDILRLVIGRSLRLIVAGTAVGLVAALSVTRVMSSLLYSVGPHDPVTFGLVTVLLILVALVATLIPARSATRVDPIVALRCE